ncbi:hypothetical protein C8R43DRAFT_1106642 [Mycena crocata]|nr:hypothetical protein C8R43DRAFT_1106642 [Mycena crocata]
MGEKNSIRIRVVWIVEMKVNIPEMPEIVIKNQSQWYYCSLGGLVSRVSGFLSSSLCNTKLKRPLSDDGFKHSLKFPDSPKNNDGFLIHCGLRAANCHPLFSQTSFLLPSPALHPSHLRPSLPPGTAAMKVTEVVVGHGDYKWISTEYGPYHWFQTEYERIGERGWGCLNPDSPVRGLCTDLVDTCLVFVFHCEGTKRTTLCHAVSGTDIAVFDAQIRYVSGEDQCGQVDIIVFQGCAYGEDGDNTMDQIRTKTMSCSTSLHPKPLDYGVVLVEKSSGEIRLPILPSRADILEPVPQYLHCIPSPPTPTTITETGLVDTFYRIQSTTSFIASEFTRQPCFEVYDGSCRLDLPPSSEDTQEVFRIATMHPNFPSLEPIQQWDADVCKRVVRTNEMQGVGAPCEVAACRKLTTKKCSKCKGAYYCSQNHQEEDWVKHKVWCRSHRYIPGGLKGCSMTLGSTQRWNAGEKKPWM